MIATLIKFLVSNFSLTFFGLGKAEARPISREAKLSRLLLPYLDRLLLCLQLRRARFLCRGLSEVYLAGLIAFQYEVGFASLGFGVVGLMAFRRDFGLRLAAVIGPTCFLWGAAGGHIYQMVAQDNFSPGNAGVVFWTDLLLPVAGIFFLARWRRASMK